MRRSMERSIGMPKPNITTKADGIAIQIGRPSAPRTPSSEIGADHRDGALREIGGARGLVDQHDAERDEPVHRPDQGAGDRKLAEQPVIHCPAHLANRKRAADRAGLAATRR